jgi:hypothetical protein
VHDIDSCGYSIISKLQLEHIKDENRYREMAWPSRFSSIDNHFLNSLPDGIALQVQFNDNVFL